MLALYPIFCLEVRGSANAILFVFTLVGLFYLPNLWRHKNMLSVEGITPRGAVPAASLLAQLPVSVPGPSCTALALLGLTPLLAALINEASRGIWYPKNLDLPLRFALIGPCVAAMLLLSRHHFRQVQWGLIAAAVISLGHVAYLNRHGARAAQIGFLNTIPFSDITLIIGFLSLLTLGWSITGRRIETILKIVGFVAGLLASAISQSRGGWVAIPLLALLSWFALRGACPVTSRKTRWTLSLIGIAIVLLSGKFVWPRVTEASNNISAFFNHGTADTSVGIRFEAWRASLMMLREHPFVGVGADQFINTLNGFVASGRVDSALQGLPHSHDEMLFALSSLGMLGGVALLCIYVGPLWFFLRRMGAASVQTRCAAAMGATLCIGYIVSGLTETFFIISMNTAIYVFFTSAFIAFVVRSEGQDLKPRSAHALAQPEELQQLGQPGQQHRRDGQKAVHAHSNGAVT
jgi:O-antigen ligase